MIDSKHELKRILRKEIALYGGGKKYLIPFDFSERQMLMKYCVTLRNLEYHINAKHKLLSVIYTVRLRRLQIKTGILIPPNTCGEGLSIGHITSTIINEKSCVGNNLRIHAGVVIGAGIDGKAPKIGNNVYIGPGAKIFGDVQIADDVRVGANAVVNKSCFERGVTLVGVPAKGIGWGSDE